MKKILALVIVMLGLVLPWEVGARAVISDKDLSEITAEEGVTIDMVNLRVGGTTTLTSFSWGDTSGFTPGYATAGYFGFKNISITGYLANVPTGTMNIDLGTSAGSGESKVIIVASPLTFGTANISGWLMGDRYPTLDNTATYAQGGILSFYGFSTQVSGTVMIYAHD